MKLHTHFFSTTEKPTQFLFDVGSINGLEATVVSPVEKRGGVNGCVESVQNGISKLTEKEENEALLDDYIERMIESIQLAGGKEIEEDLLLKLKSYVLEGFNWIDLKEDVEKGITYLMNQFSILNQLEITWKKGAEIDFA